MLARTMQVGDLDTNAGHASHLSMRNRYLGRCHEARRRLAQTICRLTGHRLSLTAAHRSCNADMMRFVKVSRNW
jgi:hypothetical protein